MNPAPDSYLLHFHYILPIDLTAPPSLICLLCKAAVWKSFFNFSSLFGGYLNEDRKEADRLRRVELKMRELFSIAADLKRQKKLEKSGAVAQNSPVR